LIDLHSHTNESDGSLAPSQLIEDAVRGGVTVLAITDHDTLAGYDQALGAAQAAGLDLVCGIELSTKLRGRSTHLLGYFPAAGPREEFRVWVSGQQQARKDRNIRLVARLRELGFDITLEEAVRGGAVW
jgi:3',5'-nucleoside bisphosphate phosphatase